MKIEIESVSNGYVITLPPDEFIEVERKYVVQEKETFEEDTAKEFQTFNDLVALLEEVLEIYNSKYNKVGFIHGLCSENQRWKFLEAMKNSLKNPKIDLGDE